MQNLEKRGYVFTLTQGDRVCNLETRLYPRNESKQTNQEIIAPNEDQIVDIYTQILTQVLDFENGLDSNSKIETNFAQSLQYLQDSFKTKINDNNLDDQTKQSFIEAQRKLDQLIAELNLKRKLISKVSSFVKLSAGQFGRIVENYGKITKLNKLLAKETQIEKTTNSIFGFWCRNIFLKNIQNLFSGKNPWRSGINFFQARDARITSDGKVQICHLEEVKVLAPYVSQARIIADALKIASDEENKSGTINLNSRAARLDKLTTVVKNMNGVDEKAFDLALKSVLLDTLTDIIKDAADELNPENGYLEGEKLEQAKASTFALIQVVLGRLGLVKLN